MSAIGNFILASRSPRRKELLAQIGIRETVVIHPDIDEDALTGLPPSDLVCTLSRQKAEAAFVHAKHDDIILAADTVVVINDRILGKPRDNDDAFSMLSLLSGKCHRVFTGVTVRKCRTVLTDFEQTDVFFRELDPCEILSYIEPGEPCDKAGGYGIQERGAVFVRRIEGDASNVIGLPLCLVYRMLSQIGFHILCDTGKNQS